MTLRFSVRRRLVAFVLTSAAVGWMTLNLRRAWSERALIESMDSDPRNRAVHLALSIKDDSDPNTLDALLKAALGLSITSVWVGLGAGQQHPAECRPAFPERMAAVSAQLDALTTIRVTDLYIYMDGLYGLSRTPGSDEPPKRIVDGRWLSDVRSLCSNNPDLPFERMTSLESLELQQCTVDGKLFEKATFPRLNEFRVCSSHVIDPRQLLACAVRSSAMTILDLGASSPVPLPGDKGNEEGRGAWTDAEVRMIGGAKNLEDLRIDWIKVEGDGFEGLAACPRLREIIFSEAVVATSLDPLLAHPSLESLEFDYSDLRRVRTPQVAVAGPALKSVDFAWSETMLEGDRQMQLWCESRQIEFFSGDQGRWAIDPPSP